MAGIQQLTHVNSSFIFATHLHEIIHYEEINELKGVVLKHMEVIYDKEKDMLIYDRKEGRGIGLYEKIKAMKLQKEGIDTFDANTLLADAPSKFYPWGINVSRQRLAGTAPEYYMLSPSGSTKFKSMESMGNLMLRKKIEVSWSHAIKSKMGMS